MAEGKNAEYLGRGDGIAWRLIDGEAVLVSTRTNTVRVLNRTAAFLWALADGGRRADEIVETAAAAFGGGSDIREAFRGFASELLAEGLLVHEDSATAQADQSAAPPVPANDTKYERPRIVSTEPLEVLAAICDSSRDSWPAGCRTLGACSRPFS